MKKIILALLLIIGTGTANAQDRVFGYMYSSNVLPVGSIDLETWNTFTAGYNPFMMSHTHQVEFEIGVVNRVQTSFYLLLTQSYSKSSITGNYEASAPTVGFSNAWKVQLSNSQVDAIGSALYFEYYIFGSGKFEFEFKLILDKRINDNHYFSFNAIAEPEFYLKTNSPTVQLNKIEMKFEVDLGYMYFINKNFGVGLELRNTNEYNITTATLAYSRFYIGPTLSYVGNKWWVIATILPQIASFLPAENRYVEARLLFAINL